MNNLKMSEIPENVHVTSVERHYKVKSSKIEFVIAVRSELDENVTKKLRREEDDELKQKAKNMLKKLFRVRCGEEKLKIIIEDPTGNSAIISDKAEKKTLKVKNN